MSIEINRDCAMWRHFDNLLWSVTSILLAANGVMINAVVSFKKPNSVTGVALLGYVLTIMTVYFAVSFRKYRQGCDCPINGDSEKDRSLGQWDWYVFLFWMIGFFWSMQLSDPVSGLSNKSPLSVGAILFMTACLFYLWHKGKGGNMTIGIKKIIAKEGLVIVGIYIVSIMITVIRSMRGAHVYDQEIFVAYPLVMYVPYLTIRFIVWAIQTLREK